LKATGKDIPFLLVTGTLGEEAAVECIKQGVSDYVLKDRLERLSLAVKRSLEEKTAARKRGNGTECAGRKRRACTATV